MKKIVSLIASVLMSATLTISAAAVGTDFSPSPGQSTTPPVGPGSTIEDENGNTLDLNDMDERGLHIVITDYTDRDNAPNDTIKQGLEDAYADLNSEDGLKFTTPEFAEQFQGYIDDAASRDKELLVIDLFDVSVVDDNGVSVGIKTIDLVTTLEYGEDIVTIAQMVGDEWILIPFVKNPDGTISIKIDNYIPNPLAVFVERGATTPTTTSTTGTTGTGSTSTTTTGTTKVPSPQTGVETSTILLVIAALLGAAGLVCVIRAKKKA